MIKRKQLWSAVLVPIIVLSIFAGCHKAETPSSSFSDTLKTPMTTVSQNTTTLTQNTAISSTGEHTTATVNSPSKATTRSLSTTKSASSLPIIVQKTLKPLNAGDDHLLFDNPDRGFRTHLTYYVSEALDRGVESYLDFKFNIFYNRLNEPCKLMMVYIYITDYRGKDISPEGMAAIQALLDRCRRMGIKLMLRFGYCDDMTYPDRNADEATMLRHIKQLAPLVKKNKQVIFSIQDGFIGAYAEWHSQVPAVNKERVLTAIMEYLVMPNDLYFQARLPEYKNELPSIDPFYDRIGSHNDAMFGAQQKEGWESGGFQLGTRAWDQVIEEAYLTPQDGETFVNVNLVSTNRMPSGMEIIMETTQHRHTSMSIWHGYKEPENDNAVMEQWKKQAVTPEILNRNHIVYSPDWFKDSKGNAVKRSAFEHIRDYLGYKLEAQQVTVKGRNKPGEKIRVTLSLKNYGMSAAFYLNSSFVLLDSQNQVVSQVKAGKPTDWHSHDPNNYLDTRVLVHTVTAELKLPQTSGPYTIAFSLRNTLNEPARLSNQLSYNKGYNLLCDLSVL